MQELHDCCTTDAALAVIGCKLKQNDNEGCNSCASLAGLVSCFIACFNLLVVAPLPIISLNAHIQAHMNT